MRIISKMSHDKAISYDLIPDNFCQIFTNRKKKLSDKYVNMLQRTWTMPISKIEAVHFKAMVVALNKSHPNILDRRIRPIIILSPIIKFLELRFQDKLMEFCKEKIHKGKAAHCGMRN